MSIAFSKFKLKTNEEMKEILFNEQTIKVKQYLPVEQKLQLIQTVLDKSIDQTATFYHSAKIEIFFALEIVYAYTDISFTDKQKENLLKLYDSLISSGLYAEIVKAIPYTEMLYNYEHLMDIVKGIYQYNNSMMGMFKNITEEYEQLDIDATQIQQKLKDPENIGLLKDVMKKMG